MKQDTPQSTFRRLERGLVALVTIVTGFSCGGLRAGEPAPTDPIIEMPKYVVTDSRDLPKPESWRYAAIPGFEVLSNATDRETAKLLSDLETFRTVLTQVWPMPDQSQTPLLLIICGTRGSFDQFVDSGTAADTKRISAFFRGRSRAAIVVDVQTMVLDLRELENSATANSDSPVAAAGPEDKTRMEVQHNKQLYREYVRYLLSRSDPRLPAWFEEGMTQIIMAMRIEPTLIEIGKVTPPDTVSAQVEAAAANKSAASEAGDDPSSVPDAPTEDRDFNVVLNTQPLMPMEQLLAVKQDSPEAMNPYGNILWAKQAYAFVHLCMYGQGGKWKKPFAQYLVRSAREPATEALFKECFGKSYKEMNLVLRQYIGFTDHQSTQYRAKKGTRLVTPPDVTLRDATQSEIGRIKGHALLLAGRMDAARTEFVAPYLRGERDPRILSGLGEIERASGKDDRARKLLTAAVAGKTDDPDAYLDLARYRFADASSAPGAANARFSPEQTSGIVELLLAARTLPPPNVATFELLADTWGRSSVRPKESDLMPLIAAVQRFPSRLGLAYTTAALCAEAGLNDPARAFVAHGLKYAPDAETRARFEKLGATLPPARRD